MSLRRASTFTQYRANRITVAPAVEPVTAAEFQAHLRIDSTLLSDDAANTLIEEARQFIEDATAVAMITQSWQLNLDRWPDSQAPWWDGVRQGHMNQIHGGDGAVSVPRWPFQNLTSVKTYDEDSNDTTITVATTFDVDLQSIPGRIALQRGATWPTAMRAVNAIEIAYVAGYGDSATDVPAPIRRAVKQMAAYLYSHRGDGCSSEEAYVESGAASIMGKYKVLRI
jgi:hypothetical protein